MTTATYRINGMTCGHCAGAVTEELKTLAGVHDVSVNVDAGEATVTSDAPLDQAAVAAAIDEAGYSLAGPRDLPLI